MTHHTHREATPSGPATSSLSSRIVDGGLTILAVTGAICLILAVAGLAFGINIMMFRTGSMSPTIPAGSIAIVREIPARDINVGDVVTVDRGEDVLPVTHRVVQVSDPDPGHPAVTFRMRGDANEYDDPSPYTATTVRRVMFSIAGAAPVIQWFSNPYVLGGLTLGATLLVTWAFWPRGEGAQQRQTKARGR